MKYQFQETLLNIRLISGQHLPSSSDRQVASWANLDLKLQKWNILLMIILILYDHEQAGDIIQPFVKIRVLGHPCDAQSWQSNAVSGTLILVMIKDHWSSKIIDQYTVHCHHDHGQVPNNGFNPTWSEEASFNIRVPELAIIEFKVLDIIEPKAMVGKKNISVEEPREDSWKCGEPSWIFLHCLSPHQERIQEHHPPGPDR